MKPVPVEQLPGGQVLYKMSFDRAILPGQWLSSGNKQFPVFHYSDQKVQFLAAGHMQLPNEFEISGEPLCLPDKNRQLLLLADNQASALLFFLLNHLRKQWGEKKVVNRIHQILMGTESAFPFKPVPSKFLIPSLPAATIASSQLLEDWQLPARLACSNDLPGCFPGSLSSMLEHLDFDQFLQTEPLIVAIGSRELLTSTKKLFAGYTNKQFLIKFEN